MTTDPTDPARGPLAGIRVLELAGLGPGPYACMLLADLGAEVIRVDRPGGAGLAMLPAQGLNRSRRCITLDLRSPGGRDTLLRLVELSDVLVEGNRPGVTERLGIGPDDALARNSRLVYARVTGWGQTGPLASAVGHDITYAAVTGALHATGAKDKPVQAVNLLADFAGGSMFMLVGVLSALVERQRSGLGQVVDAAMVDGVASLATMLYDLLDRGAWNDEREANVLDGGAPFYDVYACADGRHVAVGAIEPPFFAALVRGLGLPESMLAEQLDPSRWSAHRESFTTAFASRTRDEWVALFDGTDACVAPVLGLREAPHHPHLAQRGVFVELDGTLVPRVAPRFSRTPGLDPTPPRPTGADSVAVLSDLGWSREEIDALLSTGALWQNDGVTPTDG
jgi:alpha-methylacyl-CoA racemase